MAISGSPSLREGERHNATVLFSDMSGFTELTRSMDPEEMDLFMTSVFSMFEKTINEYGGVVEKYIGDALVAAFGIPQVHEDDASRAVNAALDFHHEVMKHTDAFRFRTAIHTGLVASGTRGEFDVITGQVMNIAARLQAAADPGAILISAQVLEQCANEFLTGTEQNLNLKGIEGIVAAYRVLGKNQTPLEFSTPFHGRREIIDRVLKMYMRHERDTPTGFCLTGEPGSGKTRIGAEFIKKARQFPDFSAPVLYSRVRRFRSLPFAAVCELIFGYLKINLFGDVASLAEQLSEGLKVSYEKAAKVAALVAEGVFASEGDIFVILHEILDGIMREVTAPYSPIVFIDNIHIMDKESKSFFRFYLANSRQLPFFLLAGRSEDRECSAIFRNLEREVLAPLEESEARDMLKSLLPDPVDNDTIERILRSTGGVPLFIEEYAAYVKETGQSSSLPPSIQSILLSTIEAYEESIRSLIKRLSVFHRSFTLQDAEWLQEISGGSPEKVALSLTFFVRQGHLKRQGRSYYFRHDLFRRTLYNALLNHNKKVLHGHIADRIASLDNVDRLSHLYHLAGAERFDELEAEFFSDPRSVYTYDYLDYLNLLLSRVEESDLRYFQLLYYKFAILYNTGRTEGSDAILRNLVDLSIEHKNYEYSARVYHILGARYLASNSFDKSIICARRAINYYSAVDENHRSIPNVQMHYANAALYNNDLELNAEVIASMSQGEGYDNYSVALVERQIQIGEYRKAEKLLKNRLAGTEPSSDSMWFGGYHKLCSLYLRLYDAENLGSLCTEMLKSRVLSIQETSETYAMAAVSAHLRGDESQSRDYLRQAEYFRYQMQNDTSIIETTRLLAVAFRTTGDIEKARLFAEEGARIGMRYAAYYHQFGLVVLLAEIYTELGNEDDARFFLSEAELIYALNPLLDPQEETVYWYLRYLYDLEPGCLENAWRTLEQELVRFQDEELGKTLLSQRFYGRIAADWRKHGNS